MSSHIMASLRVPVSFFPQNLFVAVLHLPDNVVFKSGSPRDRLEYSRVSRREHEVKASQRRENDRYADSSDSADSNGTQMTG